MHCKPKIVLLFISALTSRTTCDIFVFPIFIKLNKNVYPTSTSLKTVISIASYSSALVIKIIFNVVLIRYDEALESLDKLIKVDETNAQTRRHKVAILKAKCQTSEAIKELVEYLKKCVNNLKPIVAYLLLCNKNCRFMVDQEGWQELSNLYLLEGEYAKSAYCMEEMILHNSQNHLYHQRNADIRYTQVLKL